MCRIHIYSHIHDREYTFTFVETCCPPWSYEWTNDLYSEWIESCCFSCSLHIGLFYQLWQELNRICFTLSAVLICYLYLSLPVYLVWMCVYVCIIHTENGQKLLHFAPFANCLTALRIKFFLYITATDGAFFFFFNWIETNHNNGHMFSFINKLHNNVSQAVMLLVAWEECPWYIYASIIIINKIQEHWHSIAYDIITHVMICHVWITLMFLAFHYDVSCRLNLLRSVFQFYCCLNIVFVVCRACDNAREKRRCSQQSTKIKETSQSQFWTAL